MFRFRKINISVLSVVAMLMPILASAQSKPKVKSVDLTIPVPKPGMSLFDAREFQLISANTEYGDLATTGDIAVASLDFEGDFKENDDGDMFFKDGFNYLVRLKFMVNPDGKYDTDYIFKNNDYYIDGTRIKATVNGVEAKVLRSVPYFIDVELFMSVGSGGAGSDREEAMKKPTDYELNKNSYRGSLVAYSVKEADAVCPDTNPYDLIVINDLYHPRFYANVKFGIMGNGYPGQKCMLVTKLLVDTDNPEIYLSTAGDINNTIQGTYNIREVWISDKVNPVDFVRTICAVMMGGDDDKTKIYFPAYSMLFHSGRATLFVPEAAAPALKQLFARPTWSYHILFKIKTYSGDVHTAQKAGADAAKPLCINHVFTDKVAAADKIYRYGTCGRTQRYYYSCRICGQNEHNANHTFSLTAEGDNGPHQCEEPLADDQAYIGVNASGHHVWWYSCIWCGHSDGYEQRHITKRDWQLSGTEANYEEFRKTMAEIADNTEREALLKTTALPGMFILPHKSDAKMTATFQSVVNYALNDNLLDDAVLGKDYTMPLTQLQLRSLAVRFTEELIKKEIKLDKKQAGAFADSYSAKAAAIGLLEGHFSGSDAPSINAPATRQEVATMIYRALRYIESQGVYSYTEYDSALSRYKDHERVASWAKEPMAFMEALGLLTGISESELGPESVCTIEKAIEVTEKSTHAHQLGWYQARSWGEGTGRSYEGSVCYMPHVSGTTNHFISPGERVWVTGPRVGLMYDFLPIRESYSGERMYVKAEWFRPVRPRVLKSAETTFAPLHTRDYLDGIYIWGN